jgi:hypothetical protein
LTFCREKVINNNHLQLTSPPPSVWSTGGFVLEGLKKFFWLNLESICQGLSFIGAWGYTPLKQRKPMLWHLSLCQGCHVHLPQTPLEPFKFDFRDHRISPPDKKKIGNLKGCLESN